MIELALPAGSLESGLTAFNSGADAIYFGLKDFSARKGAINFSFDDLSKIRRFSLENGKKIYITINTLLSDSDLPSLIRLLDEVSFYGNDGIIVQDLGLSRIIKKYYPSLSLHGSTQLAVHTTEGVKELQDLGFERVVLSRELSLKEIEKIRKDCPDIELKTFIHGALCYGFSGLCSASFLKCNRSANGGECAQLCRSWFVDEESGEKGYYFSMEDLKSGEYILELNKIGIDSVKVEGRLKSPEYVAATARYYRSLLDRGFANKEDEDSLYTTFLRKSGLGYYDYKKDRDSLLSSNYPGHYGKYIGIVTEERQNKMVVETKERVESHDGLQYFVNNSGLLEAVKFSSVILDKNKNYITLKKETRDSLIGKKIYKISDSTKKEKTPSINIPHYRKPVDITITLRDDSIEAESGDIHEKKTITLSPSNNSLDIASLFEKHFSQSGESLFTLSKLTLKNLSSFSSPFIPPSFIKSFRRAFYQKMDEMKKEELILPSFNEEKRMLLPKRSLLSSDLPWSTKAKKIGEYNYITFPPVTFNEEKVWKEVEEEAKQNENVIIGINNISQVRFAKKHPEYLYFADIYLYLSNAFAASLIEEEIPTLIGGYLWFERKEKTLSWPFTPTACNYDPPYFISRACYRHDAKSLSCKGCSRNENYYISQRSEKYIVKVRDCITVVSRIDD